MTTTAAHTIIWHHDCTNTGQWAIVDGYKVHETPHFVMVMRLGADYLPIMDGSQVTVATVEDALALVAAARRFETATRYAS